jgi:hypothetical protein
MKPIINLEKIELKKEIDLINQIVCFFTLVKLKLFTLLHYYNITILQYYFSIFHI